MVDYARHDFNARMIQTSIARLQCVAAEVGPTRVGWLNDY
jgi:hypothetical protein